MNLKEIIEKMSKRCFLLFFVILLCLVQIGYSTELCAEQTDLSTKEQSLKQIGAFAIKGNAERFAEKLKSEGFEVEIREGVTQDNRTIYRVFAGEQRQPSEDTRPPIELKQFGAFAIKGNAERFAEKLKSEGFEVEIREGVTQDNRTIYRVFAKESEEPSSEVASAQRIQQDTLPEKEPVKDESLVMEEVLEKPDTVSGEALSSEGGKQIASLKVFREKKDAEEFAQRLREEGFKVETHKTVTKDKSALYTVFAEKPKELVEVPEPSPEKRQLVDTVEVTGTQEPVAEKRPSEEPIAPTEGAALTAIAVEEELKMAEKEVSGEEESPVIQKESTEGMKEPSQPEVLYSKIPQKTPPEEPSLDVETIERERITSDVFGRRGGYLHPFLSITGYYTDNVFNTPDNEESDFVTVLSPGIWLSVPRIKQKLLSLNTSNIAPGGYRLSRASENFFRRYQVYLLYGADIELFSRYDSENFLGHRIEGLFQYNFRGGLTFEFVDQFLIAHDIRGTGISTELDEYRTNITNVRLIYDTGRKLRFMVDYANFLVNYEDPRNDFRHRTDHAVSGYIFYKLRPKTSAFFQYQYIDINYGEDLLTNSEEHNFYGGLEWDITAKSKGAIKAGYGTKDFGVSDIDNGNYFIIEAQINHKFTPKTSAMLNVWRRTNETNISTTYYMLTNGIELGYNQQFTGRIMGNVRLSYINDHYKGDLTYGGETKERKDDYYIGTIGLYYKLREWLGTGVGYTFTERDSNFPEFEYTNNLFFFNITGSL